MSGVLSLPAICEKLLRVKIMRPSYHDFAFLFLNTFRGSLTFNMDLLFLYVCLTPKGFGVAYNIRSYVK